MLNVGPCVFHDPRIEELTNEKRSYWNITEYYGTDRYLTKNSVFGRKGTVCVRRQDRLYFTSQTHSSTSRTMRVH